MTFTLAKTYPRLWSLDAGVAMVVTDLHGEQYAQQAYFLTRPRLRYSIDKLACLRYTIVPNVTHEHGLYLWSSNPSKHHPQAIRSSRPS